MWNNKLLAICRCSRKTEKLSHLRFPGKKATFSAVYWSVMDPKNPFPSVLAWHEEPTETLTSPICLLLTSDVNIRMARRNMKNPSLITFRNLIVWIWYHYLYNKKLPLIKSSLLCTFTMSYESLTLIHPRLRCHLNLQTPNRVNLFLYLWDSSCFSLHNDRACLSILEL